MAITTGNFYQCWGCRGWGLVPRGWSLQNCCTIIPCAFLYVRMTSRYTLLGTCLGRTLRRRKQAWQTLYFFRHLTRSTFKSDVLSHCFGGGGSESLAIDSTQTWHAFSSHFFFFSCPLLHGHVFTARWLRVTRALLLPPNSCKKNKKKNKHCLFQKCEMF